MRRGEREGGERGSAIMMCIVMYACICMEVAVHRTVKAPIHEVTLLLKTVADNCCLEIEL